MLEAGMKSILTLLMLAVPSAFGATIFSDNFDASLPISTLNADVPGWDELNGTVDYLKSNAIQGIDCRGNAGGCIDLDGSTSNAADFTSTATFNLLAGNTYTLTYWFSGSQRSGLNTLTVAFGGETNVHSDVPANAPYTLGTLIVTPLVNSSSQIVFSNAGGDNVGLVLDDVALDESTVVPEPSALLLLGAGLAGLAVLRRRG
jgi:hypothetical protein